MLRFISNAVSTLAFIFILGVLGISSAFGKDPSVSTISFEAKVAKRGNPKASISSCIDPSGQVHIAWIKKTADGYELMYSLCKADGNISTVSVTSSEDDKEACPSIVYDKNNCPHIVCFVKRTGKKTRAGNYAVKYASDPDGDGRFEISQVSTNPQDPSDKTLNIFNSYVNGRPQISIDKQGNPVVIYLSESSKLNGYKKYLIAATKTGSGWDRKQLFVASHDDAQYDVSHGVGLPLRMTARSHMSWIDISDYNPRYYLRDNSGWTRRAIEDFGGTFANRHAQLSKDNAGGVHFIWFHRKPLEFCHATLDGASVSNLSRIPIEDKPGGNFQPGTVDPVSGRVYLYYIKSYASVGNLIDLVDGKQRITKLKGVAAVAGRRALSAYNDVACLVTVSWSKKKIVITRVDYR